MWLIWPYVLETLYMFIYSWNISYLILVDKYHGLSGYSIVLVIPRHDHSINQTKSKRNVAWGSKLQELIHEFCINAIMGQDRCKQVIVPINMVKARHDINLIGISLCPSWQVPREIDCKFDSIYYLPLVHIQLDPCTHVQSTQPGSTFSKAVWWNFSLNRSCRYIYLHACVWWHVRG